MPLDENIHLRRDRAEAFGAAAAEYDRFRPTYPGELIDDLVAAGPVDALDIGCGTGKASVLLAARGVRVLGVEADPMMAALAREHDIAVEVSGFEDWDERGRTFDLVVSAQAWHWVDPTVGARKVAGVLRPGGLLAVFWNHQRVGRTFEDLYLRFAPELVAERATDTARFETHRPYVEDLEAARFRDVHVRNYEYEVTYTSEEWVGFAQTHSDHLLLPPDRRVALVAGLRELIDGMGGSITLEAGTYTVLARSALAG